jgi:hypothetical protein
MEWHALSSRRSMSPTVERHDCDEEPTEASESERAADTVGAPEGHRVRSVAHKHVWTTPNYFGSRWYRCCQVCSRLQETFHTMETPGAIGDERWRDSD